MVSQVVWNIYHEENLHTHTHTVKIPDGARPNPPPSSDPPQHTGDPPVARHDNLTDDPASLVVVRPWVEATQGLEVAAAVAVTTATVLAAVAALIQTVVQLDSNIPLQRTQEAGQGYNHTHDKCQSSQRQGQERRRRKRRG